jgi:hypothetical protein
VTDNLEPYPDIEKVIRTLLLRDFPTDFPTEKSIATDFPSDNTPSKFCRVEELSLGTRTKLVYRPVVEVEVLAVGRDAAKSLIGKIDAHFLDYPHSVVISSGLVVLDMVTVPVVPAQRPWDSPNVRRYAGTYQFSIRR